MASEKAQAEANANLVLNVFCTEEGDAYRAYLRPAWLPRYLEPFFDGDGEAHPVLLDLDDLDRHMTANDAAYEKRMARTGGVELTAQGSAATALAVWLSTALSSGVRTRP